MNPIIVVPARMASTRLPGKPLADINGKPMIVRVLERCLEADIGPVIVATPDEEIAEEADRYGFAAILTEGGLASGSDAVWDAIQKFDPDEKHDIVVNVQGDQVVIDRSAIRSTVWPLENLDGLAIVTIAARLNDDDRDNPNIVKVALSRIEDHCDRFIGRALYFSRSCIPSGPGPAWHHIGVYAYRRPALGLFATRPPSPLELSERLEQLRALENGLTVGCAIVAGAPLEVNTQADLDHVRRLLH